MKNIEIGRLSTRRSRASDGRYSTSTTCAKAKRTKAFISSAGSGAAISPAVSKRNKRTPGYSGRLSISSSFAVCAGGSHALKAGTFASASAANALSRTACMRSGSGPSNSAVSESTKKKAMLANKYSRTGDE